VLISTNAIQTKHAQTIPPARIPLAVTHVIALTASRNLMANVLILTNAFRQIVTNMLHVQMYQVLSHVLVKLVMKVMASYVKISMSVLLIYVQRNPNVSIIKVLTHANANQDTPWIVITRVSMLMNVFMEHRVISRHHRA